MDKKIKIAQFNLTSHGGGSSTVFNNLINIFKDYHLVEKYCIYGKSDKNFNLNKFLHRIDNFFSLLFFNSYINISLNIIPTCNVSWINRSDIDILHFHWVYFNFFSIFDYPKIKKPIVWTLHDRWVVNSFNHIDNDNKTNNFLIEKLHQLKNKNLIKANIDFVCPSKWLYNKVLEKNLFPKKRVHQIYNSIDVDFWMNNDYLETGLFETNKHNTKVLFVTNEKLENKNKGFSILSKILDSSKYNNLSFEIVGQNIGNFKHEKIQSFNFHGRLDKYKLKKLYENSDMLILPSLKENLPTVLIESISCSCPVVAYNSGGVSEIVKDKVNGVLVHNYKADEFLNAINYIKNNLNILKFNCRSSVVNKFSHKTAFQNYLKLYEKIID